MMAQRLVFFCVATPFFSSKIHLAARTTDCHCATAGCQAVQCLPALTSVISTMGSCAPLLHSLCEPLGHSQEWDPNDLHLP